MRLALSLSVGLVCGLAFHAAGAETPRRLRVLPAEVRLKGPAATQSLVVLGEFEDGATRDLTSLVTIEPDAESSTLVRVDGKGRLLPLADGKGG